MGLISIKYHLYGFDIVALDINLEPYEIKDKDDKNYFIKGYIDRFDNLKNQVNIVDYKSKKADGVLQDKLEEIKNFKDFTLICDKNL